MDEATQNKACQTAKLFSRVEPAHKSKIVDYLQKEGAVAAMVRFCATILTSYLDTSTLHLQALVLHPAQTLPIQAHLDYKRMPLKSACRVFFSK